MHRICGQFQETIHHIVAGCPELAKTEYLHRHNKAAMLIPPLEHLRRDEYRHKREMVRAWAQTVTRQHHNLVANANTNRSWDKGQRPDIVIKNKHEKSCLLIDMSIRTEKNTSVKVTERPRNQRWKNVGDKSYNNSGSDRGHGTNQERVGKICATDCG